MNTELVPVEHASPITIDHAGPQELFALSPKDKIKLATEISTALADVIERQKLYSVIGDKKYVRVDGWNALGALLSIIPREVSCVEQNDGSFLATVELISLNTQQIVGRATALCGVDEYRWRKAEKYARRSMAVTRATGKAFRLGYSWIMALAGYEPTPQEEMQEKPDRAPRETAPRENSPNDDEAKPVHIPVGSVKYTKTKEQEELIRILCQRARLNEEQVKLVQKAMIQNTMDNLQGIVDRMASAQ